MQSVIIHRDLPFTVLHCNKLLIIIWHFKIYIKGDVKSILRTHSAQVYCTFQWLGPTIGMLLIFRTFRTFLN
jgi:hypothetical protein